MPEWCKSNHKRLMRPFTIPRHHSSSKKRFAPSLCLPPKCAAHPQAWSFPGAVGCREDVPAPCQSCAPGTARGLLSQESARREKTRAGRMWRVGRPPEVQPVVTALPGCGMAPLPPRHWGSGKSSSLTAPIRASSPGNLLPKKPELDLRHGCPEARGKPGFAPLRNPQRCSIMEIPEHKGGLSGWGCTGPRPAWDLVSPVGTSPGEGPRWAHPVCGDASPVHPTGSS